MLYDFHTHTFLSDGELSPVELIRRAVVHGYSAIGIADHAGPGNVEHVVKQLVQDCRFCERHWDVLAFPGVELTHLPPAGIAEVAAAAKEAGAKLVVVHGETPAEPVQPGTNLAAVSCPDVDLIGHPGFLTDEEARIAVENGVRIELTARRGHSLTNGHVARVGTAAGVQFLVDSDGHAPGDLLTTELAMKVALGAGLDHASARTVLRANPQEFILKLQGGRRI